MVQEDSVNSQITDSVTQANTINIGNGPASTQAMVDAASAETIGIAMHNAVTAQQNMQMLTSASITSACAKMISMAGISLPPSPPSQPSTLPPLVPQKNDKS